MIELIYHSQASFAFDQKIVDGILEPARARNAAEDVTGMLFFDGEKFIQLLEGPEEKVDKIFGSIRSDIRHENVCEIYRGTIFNKGFTEWRMGYKFTSPLTGLMHEYDWNARQDLSEASKQSKNPGAQFFEFMNRNFLKPDNMLDA